MPDNTPGKSLPPPPCREASIGRTLPPRSALSPSSADTGIVLDMAHHGSCSAPTRPTLRSRSHEVSPSREVGILGPGSWLDRICPARVCAGTFTSVEPRDPKCLRGAFNGHSTKKARYSATRPNSSCSLSADAHLSFSGQWQAADQRTAAANEWRRAATAEGRIPSPDCYSETTFDEPELHGLNELAHLSASNILAE